MKKRILSLVLAFAMAATLAPAMAGTTSEAASTAAVGDLIVERENANKVITSGGSLNAKTVIELKAKSPAGTERISNPVIGDTVEIKDFNSGDFKVALTNIDDTSSVNTMDESNVNIQWVVYDSGASGKNKLKAIDGETKPTLELTDEHIGKKIAVVIWVPGRNGEKDFDDYKTQAIGIESYASVTKALYTNRSTAWEKTMSNYATGMVSAALASGTAVKESKLTTKDFVFRSAKGGDGAGLIRVGNTLIAKSGQVSKDNIKDLQISFDLRDGIGVKDAWGRNYEDDASAYDPLQYRLCKQDKGDSTYSEYSVEEDTEFDSAGKTRSLTTDTAYDVWVKPKNAGKLYDNSANSAWVQTDITLMVKSSGDCLVVIDLDGGDLPNEISARYGFDQNEVSNRKYSGTDKFATKSVAVTYNNSEGIRFYDLPILPKKGDKFFQGYTETKGGALLKNTSELTTRYDKLYYAVWGDNEVKNDVPVGGQSVYRLLNPANGEHLYTAQIAEVNALTAQGWTQEENNFYGLATGGVLVQRLFNPVTGEHIYVDANGNEKRVLVSQQGWLAEDIVFRSADAGLGMYRLYNPTAPAVASHLYTTDANEYNVLGAQGWNKEGVYFFGVQ